MKSIENITILLVEDDVGHATLIQKNLRRSNISNPIIHLDNGQRALEFLFREGEFKNEPKELPPLLILLDLNLPLLHGHKLLEKIKNDPRTKLFPVIVLTTTSDKKDIELCYQLGANVYITKPVEYDKFSKAVQELGLLLSVVKVPNN